MKQLFAVLLLVFFLGAASPVMACNGIGVGYSTAYGYGGMGYGYGAQASYQQNYAIPAAMYNFRTIAIPSMMYSQAVANAGQALAQTTQTTTTTITTTPAIEPLDPAVRITQYQSPTVTSLYSYSAYPTGYTYQPYSLYGNFGYGLYGGGNYAGMNYGGYGGSGYNGRVVPNFFGHNYR